MSPSAGSLVGYHGEDPLEDVSWRRSHGVDPVLGVP
jgi:hypothetical protein